MDRFASIDTWVFDLDNTLYPRHCDLFHQIDIAMTSYVAKQTGLDHHEARKLQKDLYRDYGTTLNGMMATRQIDPHDFLSAVHDIDYSPLPKTPQLNQHLAQLPGRRIIYTNGSVEHAENTLAAMGIDTSLFDGIFDIVASNFEPKPMPSAFSVFLEKFDVDPQRSAMFEDLSRNLEPAKQSGMVTVLITPKEESKTAIEAWEHGHDDHEHIDHRTDDIELFLRGVLDVV